MFFCKKCSLEPSRNHIPLAIFATWRARNPKSEKTVSKVDFRPIIHFRTQKLKFGAKIEFLCRNTFLCPLVADAYKTNGILTKMDALMAQSRFLG